MHTACFSTAITDAELDVLDDKKAVISGRYSEYTRRSKLPEYMADPIFRQETEELRMQADTGMMDLANEGHVEAYIWQEKRKVHSLKSRRDTILSALELAQRNLEEKSNGIRLEGTSKLRRDLDNIDGQLTEIQDNLRILKKLKQNNIRIVQDMPCYLETQYNLEHNISIYTPSDEDEEPEIEQETLDKVSIFRSNTRRILNELIELETDLLTLGRPKTEEALHCITLIQAHIDQNGYLDSTDDRSNNFIKFIYRTIRESTDYSYAVRPSFRAVSRVRDTLFNALILLSSDDTTSADILVSFIRCLLTPSNKLAIYDKIDCVKAELQIIGEIKRYSSAFSDPADYAQLTYKELYESKDQNEIRAYYMNEADYSSCVFAESLLVPANDRLFTLQTFFINASCNAYKSFIRSEMIEFMDFGRKNYRISLADIEKYVRNQNREDCPYYVHVQPLTGAPTQTILISKRGPYSIRYNHVRSKLTIGYLQKYPYDKNKKQWVPNSSGGLLVHEPKNEIIKYARYDVVDFVTPANRHQPDGFLNVSSYAEETRLLCPAHRRLN
jgi:hypothetical protein